jgi:hypothetical protein
MEKSQNISPFFCQWCAIDQKSMITVIVRQTFNTRLGNTIFKKHILASMNYFDSDMSKSTNTVVYFDWKTVIYIYVCGKCRTQFMLPNSSKR